MGEGKKQDRITLPIVGEMRLLKQSKEYHVKDLQAYISVMITRITPEFIKKLPADWLKSKRPTVVWHVFYQVKPFDSEVHEYGEWKTFEAPPEAVYAFRNMEAALKKISS